MGNHDIGHFDRGEAEIGQRVQNHRLRCHHARVDDNQSVAGDNQRDSRSRSIAYISGRQDMDLGHPLTIPAGQCGSTRRAISLATSSQFVAGGETVFDVPPVLASRVRLMRSGRSQNDSDGARSTAIAALRSDRLGMVRPDQAPVEPLEAPERSTVRSTSPRSAGSAKTPRVAPTTTARSPKASRPRRTRSPR